MTLNNVAKVMVLGLAVLLATGAFASNKGSLHVQEAVQVNGQQIPAGDYQVRWEGTGSNVEVSVMQGKKVVTKTSARLIDLQNTSAQDALVVDRSSGSPSVSQVRFAGKKYALALGGGEKAEMNAGSIK
jgi:hypothetical protein